jgi:hypothetical protein
VIAGGTARLAVVVRRDCGPRTLRGARWHRADVRGRRAAFFLRRRPEPRLTREIVALLDDVVPRTPARDGSGSATSARAATAERAPRWRQVGCSLAWEACLPVWTPRRPVDVSGLVRA